MMKPRAYQQSGIDALFNYFRRSAGNPLLIMPTGTGKSVVIGAFLKTAFANWPNQRIMMLTHVKELIEQNYEKLMQIWPAAPAGIFSASVGRKDCDYPITFGGIQSVAKNPKQFGKIDLIIIDECHLVSEKDDSTYRQVIAILTEINPFLKVIGLTATGYRLKQGRLTEGENPIFTDVALDMCTPEGYQWFVDEGYLSPLISPSTTVEYNMEGCKTRAGDFEAKDMDQRLGSLDLTEKICREILDRGTGRNSCLVFCASIARAQEACDIFNSLGVPFGCVHSKLTKTQREEILAKFKSGELWGLTNNGVLTTGFDHPLLDVIAIMRPSQSASLHVQILGRGTRPVYADGFDLGTTAGRLEAIAQGPKQNCLILDFACNIDRLGPINDPVIPKLKGKGGGIAPVKRCPECGEKLHCSVRRCTGTLESGFACTHEFEFITKLNETASINAMVKVVKPPKVVDYEVAHVVYSKNARTGGTPSLKASYQTTTGETFTEFVCLQHTSNVIERARTWWKQHDPVPDSPVPATVDEALLRVKSLKPSTSIRVWVNQKYPSIIAHCHDGSHFGRMQPRDVRISSDVDNFNEQMQARHMAAMSKLDGDHITPTPTWYNADSDVCTLTQMAQTAKTQAPIDFDDDIPF